MGSGVITWGTSWDTSWGNSWGRETAPAPVSAVIGHGKVRRRDTVDSFLGKDHDKILEMQMRDKQRKQNTAVMLLLQ